ncbi:MAG TPA: hypothetical protein VFI83_06455 [Gaiella sp.]|jgi:hypothetical protein|nr:hypothetical protein [Gaiella sp.]
MRGPISRTTAAASDEVGRDARHGWVAEAHPARSEALRHPAEGVDEDALRASSRKAG